MGRISINHIVRRWVPTAGAGMVPLVTPMLFNGVSWPIAVALSAAGMLFTGLITTTRFVLPEILQHLRRVQQLRDQHTEGMLREGNQHTEVMQLLDKVNEADTFDVDVARVVQRIRAFGSSVAVQLPTSPAITGTPAGPTAVNVEPISASSTDRQTTSSAHPAGQPPKEDQQAEQQ